MNELRLNWLNSILIYAVDFRWQFPTSLYSATCPEKWKEMNLVSENFVANLIG